MPAFRTTGRLIRAYAESEPWKDSHDEAIFCRDMEEILTWGVRLFHVLNQMGADIQARALEDKPVDSDLVWAGYDQAYRALVAASECFLKIGTDLAAKGYEVTGLDGMRQALDEARCQLELWDLESELPSIEEARPLARPENPRPARYEN